MAQAETVAHISTPEELFDVVTLLYKSVEMNNDPDERRVVERERLFVPVRLQFVDDNLHPQGASIDALTRDVSHGGVGILSTIDPLSNRAIARFPNEGTEPIMVEIRFSRRLGPFVHLGCSFCVDWS